MCLSCIPRPVAKVFVSGTLHSARESLHQVVSIDWRALQAFLMLHQAKSTIESGEMIDPILAGLLVQTISLFPEIVDQRPATTRAQHRMTS
jgi:hypothetical protein